MTNQPNNVKYKGQEETTQHENEGKKMDDRFANVDSREAFDSFADQLDEQDLYGDFEDGGEDCENDPYEDDVERFSDYDGQPSEYDEWMDFDPDC